MGLKKIKNGLDNGVHYTPSITIGEANRSPYTSALENVLVDVSGNKNMMWLRGAVDVRLDNDEVLDIEQLQDRFKGEVMKVGNDLRVSKDLPIADFQNYNGEVLKAEEFKLIQN